jgi:pyruvate dehydrogenase E2 component (dihydrolipoamide acetyltransferase)
MEQGTFVGWLKKLGDHVRPGEPLFTLEGEKAIQEIEAVDAGTLHFDPTNPAEGDIVAVGATIGFLLAIGETAPSIPPRPAPSAPKPSSASASRPPASDTKPASLRNLPATRSADVFAPPASPAVRRLARQLGVDLSPLGSAGRISEADVCRRYLQSRGEFLPSVAASKPNSLAAPPLRASDVPRRSRDLPTISPRAAHTAARLGVDWTRIPGTGSQGRIRERDVLAAAGNIDTPTIITTATARSIRITPLRRTISQRMVTSLQQTAPVTLTTEIEVTSLVAFREQLKRSGESSIPSITDLFVKLAAMALQEHPVLNARWRDDAIELCDEVHIGIAVDTTDGLLVPVIRDAHRQSVFEIARQSLSLVEKARARRLTAQESQGGTFTITNLGSFGIDAFTPIINFPETAILGLGRIRNSSAISRENDSPQPVPRSSPLMTLSLTFDHRVLDGAPAARFLQTLARLTGSNAQSLFEPPTHR